MGGASRPFDQFLLRHVRSCVRTHVLPIARDVANLISHGRPAPRFAERVWVRPGEVTKARAGRGGSYSGTVLRGDWDLSTAPIESVAKFSACVEHWKYGKPWEDTGIFELMQRLLHEKGSVDRCRDLDDVRRRYEELDRIFERVKTEGRFRTSVELKDVVASARHREPHGIIIHVDRHGMPIHGVGGSHRLAMASVLELSAVPARVGVVHPAALRVWRERYAAGATAVA